MICRNCNNTFEGNFCNQCGQSAKVERMDFKYLIKELPNSIFQLNRGFFFTTKELFIRPGHSIRAYFEGKRKQHYKPIAFLILCTALYGIITYFTGRNTILDDLIFGFKSGMEEDGDAPLKFFLDWLSKNQVYAAITIIPIYSTASYLAFRKSKYNYIEHLVLNFYITGQQMLIYLLLSFVFFKDNVFAVVPFLAGVFYNFWTFYQFFNEKPSSTKFFLMILTYIIFFLLSIIAFFILGVLASILT